MSRTMYIQRGVGGGGPNEVIRAPLSAAGGGHSGAGENRDLGQLRADVDHQLYAGTGASAHGGGADGVDEQDAGLAEDISEQPVDDAIVVSVGEDWSASHQAPRRAAPAGGSGEADVPAVPAPFGVGDAAAPDERDGVRQAVTDRRHVQHRTAGHPDTGVGTAKIEANRRRAPLRAPWCSGPGVERVPEPDQWCSIGYSSCAACGSPVRWWVAGGE